jgi:hypothetical protein
MPIIWKQGRDNALAGTGMYLRYVPVPYLEYRARHFKSSGSAALYSSSYVTVPLGGREQKEQVERGVFVATGYTTYTRLLYCSLSKRDMSYHTSL